MNKKTKKIKLLSLLIISFTIICLSSCGISNNVKKNNVTNNQKVVEEENKVSSACIVASGDMLYHMPVICGASTGADTYDFKPQFQMIKPLISDADVALGDFEGCIAPGRPYSGFPLFNAPPEVTEAIKWTGYDVIDIAHNHILDMGLDGAFSTKNAFEDIGLDTIGVRDNIDSPILIKNVNGIKIAILGFCYGYNGMENNLSGEEYNAHMDDLNMENVKDKIEKAEKAADITVVMPQLGNEYQTQPSEEQKNVYREMVDMGADIIFGGHPHVPEPAEVIEKDGENKFILYSMGNLISNQRIETMGDVMNSKWTERGIIMEVNIKKEKGKTIITSLTPHPTWVQKHCDGRYCGSVPAPQYKVLLTENYMPGGKYEGTLSPAEEARVQNTYIEMMELLNIKNDLLKEAA